MTGDARFAAAADQLRLFFEQLVRLDIARREISEDMADVRKEAKAHGFDTKVLSKMVERHRKDPSALIEFDGILETYEAALGVNAQAAGMLSTRRAEDGSFEVAIAPPQASAAARRLTRKQEQLRDQMALAAAAQMARSR